MARRMLAPRLPGGPAADKRLAWAGWSGCFGLQMADGGFELRVLALRSIDARPDGEVWLEALVLQRSAVGRQPDRRRDLRPEASDNL
jgi:hypothetical protein